MAVPVVLKMLGEEVIHQPLASRSLPTLQGRAGGRGVWEAGLPPPPRPALTGAILSLASLGLIGSRR